MHTGLLLAFAPIGHPHVGAAEHFAAFRTPDFLDPLPDGRDAAAGLATHKNDLDAECFRLDAQNIRRLLAQKHRKVRRCGKHAGPYIRRRPEQTIRPAIRANRNIDNAHILHGLGNRHAADEAFRQRESM